MSHTPPARSHAGDVTVEDRLKQFPKEFYIDHGILMCLACEKAVDHQRKSSVVSHLKTEKHGVQLKAKAKQAETAAAAAAKVRSAYVYAYGLF